MFTFVQSTHWITILNKEGIRNANCTFTCGDQAMIETGGRLDWLGRDEDGILCRYTAPAGTVPAGTDCPSGALCVLSDDDFNDMAAQAAELDRLRALLGGA